MSRHHSSVESSVSSTTTAQIDPTTAEFSLPATGFALAEFFERVPDARIECEPTVANPEDHTLLVIESDRCREEVMRILQDSPAIAALEEFAGSSDRWRCRVTWRSQPHELIREIIARDVAIVSLFGENGVWKLRLRAATRSDLTEIDSLMDHLDCGAECLRISCVAKGSERDHYQLTTEQQAALTEAAKAGYYEIPRAATSTEVAERLGISHQALSERLRRAHSQLVDIHLRIDDGTDTHERGE